MVITVNKKKVIMPKYIKDSALWPKLIEKAYLIYRNKGYELLNGKYKKGYKSLDNGYEIDVMFAITGKKLKHLNYTKKDIIISKIKSKSDKNQAITCGFNKKFKIKDVKSGEEIQICNHHAYAIVGIDENKKYIRLINPWKAGGRKVENSPKSKEGGHIAMSFKDFEDNYRDISYTTNKSY